MKKINFANAQQVLSKKEMKNVLGGSGIYGGDCGTNPAYCSGNCTTSRVTPGTCKHIYLGGNWSCACYEN